MGLLKKVAMMCFSIWYWMESNLSEMFPCVNSQTEAVSISWTGRRWNPSTKFIHFWSHGFYEAEGARRWFGNTAELVLGKTSRREVACCLLCFLGWRKRVAVTDVLQHWPSSGVFPLRSSQEMCDFSPHFYDIIVRSYICFYLQILNFCSRDQTM